MVAYSYQGRFYAPIRVGLGLPIEPVKGIEIRAGVKTRPKTHTIRAYGKKPERHAKVGQELQHYFAQRSPLCHLIGRSRCTRVSQIEIWIGTGDELAVSIDGEYFCGSTDVREFAQSDGFDDAADMVAFWREQHPGVDHFEGVMIDWKQQ